ncbi:MAG: cardiolipin synthase [Desulfobacteraceae bacterium 4572_35.1]|nr:MAG: cardiolipin synthase [Desulfobacteraceae bacterium 4572_35.1]
MAELEIIIISVAYLISTVAALHVLLNKRDPRAALLWIVVCFWLPVIGVLLYMLLGMNRIRTRAQSWQDRGQGMHPVSDGNGEQHEESAPLIPPYATQNYQLLRQLSDRVTRRPLLAGNRVQPLHNGDQAYPAMLEAIANAQHCIALSTYIFDTHTTGKKFITALNDAAQRGVKVKVLVDGLGKLYSWPRVDKLFVNSKVQIAYFLPATWQRRGIHFNLRNHRKLLVLDGETAFTGGMNISYRHLLQKTDDTATSLWNRNRTIDIHFKVEGPVVGQMQETFREDWHFATGETFSGRNYPAKCSDGNCLCRGISAGPNEKYEKLVWLVIGALNCARKQVLIMTPYFIPDRMLVSALISAQLRGVSVEIMLPQKNNLPYVQWASRGTLHELLEYGIKVYCQPPPFVHSKLLLMDDSYALIGSANVDPRSQRLNFEFVLELYDIQVNNQLREHFTSMRLQSNLVTVEQINQRNLTVKLRDNFFRLFSPFL